MSIRPIYIALAVIGTTLGMLVAAGGLLLSQRRELVVFDCGADANPEVIVRSGPEFILANPSVKEGSNSYLVSLELRDPAVLPARWRFGNATITSADASGFVLRSTGEGGQAEHRFSSANGEWRSSYGKDSTPDTVRCRRLKALPDSVSRFSGIPVEYLSQRPWPLSVLNPDLREANLRLALARVVSGRSGSDYSFYKLVAPLPRTGLTPADEERLTAARKQLVSELSSTETFWEYSGNSTAGWEYSNEQSEAQRHADIWCRERSDGALANRLSEGWQVASSVAQSIDSGQQKQLYPDGRFAGYVNYTARCQGTQYTLRKDADLTRLP